MPSKLLTLVMQHDTAGVGAFLQEALHQDRRFLPNTIEENVNEQPGIALHMAIDLGFFDIAHLLLRYKADPNLQTHQYEQTALHYASKKYATELLAPLIQAGARLDLTDCFDQTAFKKVDNHYVETQQQLQFLTSFHFHMDHLEFLEAVRENNYNKVVKLLDDYRGVDYYYQGQTTTMSYRIDPNYEGGHYGNALFNAAQLDSPKILELLLQRAVNPFTITGTNGFTILHLAIIKGSLETLKWILSEKKLEALINASDDEGDTALHLATKYCQTDMIELLLATPCIDRNLCNKTNNETAAGMAKRLVSQEKARFQKVLNIFNHDGESTSPSLNSLAMQQLATQSSSSATQPRIPQELSQDNQPAIKKLTLAENMEKLMLAENDAKATQLKPRSPTVTTSHRSLFSAFSISSNSAFSSAASACSSSASACSSSSIAPSKSFHLLAGEAIAPPAHLASLSQPEVNLSMAATLQALRLDFDRIAALQKAEKLKQAQTKAALKTVEASTRHANNRRQQTAAAIAAPENSHQQTMPASRKRRQSH